MFTWIKHFFIKHKDIEVNLNEKYAVIFGNERLHLGWRKYYLIKLKGMIGRKRP